jgi:carbon storage regulator CsrA
LTRRIGQAIRIGDDVTVTVLGMKTGHQISLGIHAPRSVSVHRKEVFNQIAQEQQPERQPERQPLAEPQMPAPDKPVVKIVVRNRKRQRVRTDASE